jgi:hypothetical protein
VRCDAVRCGAVRCGAIQHESACTLGYCSWCYDEVDCLCRSKTSLGTSTVLPKTGGCSCMNPNEDGSMVTDCNCIHLPYSDGASFSGESHDSTIPVNILCSASAASLESTLQLSTNKRTQHR